MSEARRRVWKKPKLRALRDDEVQTCEPLHARLTKDACAQRWEHAQKVVVHTERFDVCRSCEVGKRNAKA